MIKALREAKEHSSWVKVNTDYEGAMSGFVQALLAPGEKNLFLADFVPLVQSIAHHGLINALAQTLIKLTSPGVPDIYQGCELWQFNLVDPDNRRPVDFTQRRALLAETRALTDAPPEQWPKRLQPLLADMRDGRIKLYTLWQSLALRARWPEVFRDGDYLAPDGARQTRYPYLCLRPAPRGSSPDCPRAASAGPPAGRSQHSASGIRCMGRHGTGTAQRIIRPRMA